MIDFWNGNRSQARQDYEREVLKAVLNATEKEFGNWQIEESTVEYPGEQESLVFTDYEHDLFVTIAGNQKFEEGDMFVIPRPLTKNLLGYRIPIIREQDTVAFNNIDDVDDIRKLEHGIPSTWSDATIFRHNDFRVAEEGDFDDIFERLQNGRFDYSAYGANEILGVYRNRVSKHENLTIDKNLILFYPFPLVFYVNPEMSELTKRINKGLQIIAESGELDRIFSEHYGDIVEKLDLDQRRIFVLENPLVPEEFADLEPDLTDFKL
ncbi:MAG: hypothetical protein ACQEQ0_09940 [Bacteroidota bacterium]